MSVQRFTSLLFRAAKIQKEIEKEHARRGADWMRLLKLKRLRMAISHHLRRFVFDTAGMQLQPVRAGTTATRMRARYAR